MEVVFIIQSQWQREKPTVKLYHIALNQCLFSTIVMQITSSSKSETDIREQASFTERLGSTSWCECTSECTKCAPMPSGIECRCCKEMEDVVECVPENESHQCIMDHEQFKVVCLNKDVLYTALVMMNTIRGDLVSLPLPSRKLLLLCLVTI